MTPMGSEPRADFDRWLRRQLLDALDPELGPRPHPAAARYAAASRHTGGRRVIPIRFSISAALGAKALVGGAVAALAAGAAAGTVTTGSMNPAAWGQHVSEAVEMCKAADVNVGKCVSAIAQEHGEQVRAQHSEAVEKDAASPSPSAKPGQREGQETGQSSNAGGNGATASAGHGQGHDAAAATPTPAGAAHDDHGHGKPSPRP
jgi:hypothetical protein